MKFSIRSKMKFSLNAKWLEKMFSIDVRALSAFRVGVGLILFVDYIFRALDIESFYSSKGVLPLSSFIKYRNFSISLNFAHASDQWQLL